MSWPVSGGGTFVNLKNKTGRVIHIGEVVRKVRNSARLCFRYTEKTILCVALQNLATDQTGPFALEGQISVKVDFRDQG